MGLIRAALDSRLFWGLLGVALFWSLGRIAVRDLARDTRFDAHPRDLALEGPAWGGDEVMDPVRLRLEALGPVNLFHPRFAALLGEALLEVPGVASVDEVRKIWPRRYTVGLTLRRPVAVVEFGDRDVPVTGDAVVLPLGAYERASRGLPRIVGVDSQPPRAGEAWRNSLLNDGLAAVAQIGPHLPALAPLGIHTIDVSRADVPLDGVLLLGRDEIRIRYGRPRARVGENPVARKLEFLRIVAEGVERARGREIDIRWREIGVRESRRS